MSIGLYHRSLVVAILGWATISTTAATRSILAFVPARQTQAWSLSSTKIQGTTCWTQLSMSRPWDGGDDNSSGSSTKPSIMTTTTVVSSKDRGKDEKTSYSQELYLREETESPFRKVRFFFYFALGGGALTSLFLSGARVAAGLAGINSDLMQESLTNVAVDVAGLIVFGFLYQQDLAAQESRLKRASKGADLARLVVRASSSLLDDDTTNLSDKKRTAFNTPLASLRRGRGIEKRVVIAAAGAERIAQIVQEARDLHRSLTSNDLLVIPVVLPQVTAPLSTADSTTLMVDLPECVALPVGNGWKDVIADESEEALKQGVNLLEEGFCVILKKNGRVGQRTKGIFLNRMVSEVEERRDLSLDVKNI